MANSAINVVSAPAPAAPAAGGGVQGGAGTGGASKEGPSFKDLLAGAEASAPPPEGAATSGGDALPPDAGGEESPPDGNPLPLASPLLPPAEVLAVPVAPETDEAPPPAFVQAAPMDAEAVAPPPLAAPVAEEVTSRPTAETGSSVPVGHKPSQAQPTSGQAAVTPPAAEPRPAGNADAMVADSEQSSSSVAFPASRLPGSEEGVDDAPMRRLLASLYSNAPAQNTPTPADTPASVQAAPAARQAPPSPVTQLNAAAAADALPMETPATHADRLLRELKFELPSEVTVQTPASTPHAPAHLQPQPTTTASATTSAPAMQLQTPMQNRAEWAEGLGERVLVMANGAQQNASIRLNPAHLGPIEVQVSMAGDQTTVTFTAHHGATREALEAATPRLREMLGSQGFTHVNVNINHQSPGDRSTQGQAQPLWPGFDARGESDGASTAGFTQMPTATGRSRLDTYA